MFLFNTVLLPLVLMNFVIALIVKTHDNFHHLKYFTDYREMIVLLQTMNSFTRGIFSSETGIMSQRKQYVHLIVEKKEDQDLEKRLKKLETMLEVQ